MSSLLLHNHKFHIEIFNDDFALLKSEEQESLQILAKALYEKKFDFIDEVIGTEVEICLKFNEAYTYDKLSLFHELNITQDDTQHSYTLPVYIHHDSDDWLQIDCLLYTSPSPRDRG